MVKKNPVINSMVCQMCLAVLGKHFPTPCQMCQGWGTGGPELSPISRQDGAGEGKAVTGMIGIMEMIGMMMEMTGMIMGMSGMKG